MLAWPHDSLYLFLLKNYLLSLGSILHLKKITIAGEPLIKVPLVYEAVCSSLHYIIYHSDSEIIWLSAVLTQKIFE